VAKHSQEIAVSQAAPLIAALEALPGCHQIRLEKHPSATGIAGTDELDGPAWRWPQR
jgi:predicted ATPase